MQALLYFSTSRPISYSPFYMEFLHTNPIDCRIGRAQIPPQEAVVSPLETHGIRRLCLSILSSNQLVLGVYFREFYFSRTKRNCRDAHSLPMRASVFRHGHNHPCIVWISTHRVPFLAVFSVVFCSCFDASDNIPPSALWPRATQLCVMRIHRQAQQFIPKF